MAPAASVSGLYFAHPQARYFTVGRIGRDQVESYAKRAGMSLREAERWLAPNLATSPRGLSRAARSAPESTDRLFRGRSTQRRAARRA